MRTPTLKKRESGKILDFFNIREYQLSFATEADFLVIDTFYIDVSNFWKHIDYIKQKFNENVFQKEPFLFKNIDKIKDGKIWGTISFTKRAGYRDELVFNFGKKTSVHNSTIITKEEKIFEDFVFGGFFGGELKGIDYNFVNLVINRNTKEIKHSINLELMEKAIVATYQIDPTFLEQNKDVDLDFEKEEKTIISIEREANLSEKHNKIQNLIFDFCNKKNIEVKKEFKNTIDIFIKHNNIQFIIEVKTSYKEFYKGIGQLLSYKNLLEDNLPIKLLLITDLEYNVAEHIAKTMDINDIKVINIENFIYNFFDFIK